MVLVFINTWSYMSVSNQEPAAIKSLFHNCISKLQAPQHTDNEKKYSPATALQAEYYSYLC